jgi:apolipoprotein N-acyltransferase
MLRSEMKTVKLIQKNALILLLGLSHGLCLTLSFAPFNYPFVAWLGLWPLFYFCRRFKDSARSLIFVGILCAFCTCLFSFYWLFYYLDTLGDLSLIHRLLLFFCYSVLLNLKTPFFVLLFGIGYRLKYRKWLPARWFTAGVLGLFADYLAPQIFPWYWGNLLAGNPFFAQFAEYTGIYGLSFILFAGSFWLYRAVFMIGLFPASGSELANIKRIPRFVRRSLTACFFRRRIYPVPVFLLFLLILGAGLKYKTELFQQTLPTVRVAVIQPNAPLEMSGPDNVPAAVINRIITRTIPDLVAKAAQASQGKLDLIILPESAVPYYSTDENAVTKGDNLYFRDFELMVKLLTYNWNADVFLNEITLRQEDKPAGGNPAVKYFNSSVLYSRNGKRQNSYQKRILLAFGEYIPGADFLKRTGLINLIPATIREVFNGGKSSNLIAFDIKNRDRPVKYAAPLTHEMLKGFISRNEKKLYSARGDFRRDGHFMPLICYEVLFPEYVRTFFENSENPDFMVNQTQDGWFGNSIESFQHFELGRLRAIEYRRAIVRATNSGTSGFVDLAGNYTAPLAGPVFTAQGTEAFQVWDVPINRAPPTFYARFGNMWMMLLLALFLVPACKRICRRKSIF